MKSKKKRRSLGKAGFQYKTSVAPGRSKTALKESKSALKKSNDRFRSLVEMTSDWIWEVDTHGVYTYVSPKVTDLLGYTIEEVLGKTPFDLMPPEEARSIAALVKPIIDSAQPIRNLENINIHKEGKLVLLETNGVPIFDISGNQVGYRGIDRDITDRKQMEEDLKKSEQRFRSLSEASLEAIVFIEDGIIVDANEALNRLFSYEGEDLRGRPATDFIVPERRAFTDERMRTRTIGAYETLGLRKDGGAFPIEVNAREFEHDGKRLRISAVRDLTERKKIEKQLGEHQKQLEKLVEERTNELKQSEKKYRDIFENAQEGIFKSTPDGHLISANPALASMFGSETPDELIKLTNDIPAQVYVDWARRHELADILAREGFVQNFALRFRRRDGVTKHASMNARAVRDAQGTILYYEGTVQDITEKKETEKSLEDERHNLEEANTALKVLLKHRENDKKELEERFVANVKQLILPYIEKLKSSKLESFQQTTVNVIESNLNEIVTPFLNNIKHFNFTSRQFEIINLIREGRTTKEIAHLLSVGKEAIDLQRFLIRKKLKINKKKTNLRSYLRSLAQY